MQKLSFLFLLIAISFCQPINDKITYLPGLINQPAFAQYSGYINVTYGDLFYWFVESQNNPAEDPVVLWLNGGPGCSSLEGLLSENGPFNAAPNISLENNPHSWNKIANMLYLESPPGVGFSINKANFYYNDSITATTNYEFLQNWFSNFSAFQSNEFWITGESYAGHYIPTLAKQILSENTNANNSYINLKGFAIGNPATDDSYDAAYQLSSPSHGLSSLHKRFNRPGLYGNINVYDILADVCYETSLLNRIRFPNPTMDSLRMHLSNQQLRDVPARPPCIADYVTSYLDNAAVQAAIHAVPKKWNECGGPNYRSSSSSMIPYYLDFLANSTLKMLIYSGDQDTVIPFMGTEQWVIDLNQTNLNFWGPWYSDWSGTNQVAGYWINFDKIWYCTVKGAGHMVPWFQPGPAFTMFANFLTSSGLS